MKVDERVRAFLLEAENWLERHADPADPGAVRLLSRCRVAQLALEQQERATSATVEARS